MDQKNVLIAVLISLAILMGWQILFEHPKLERERQQQAAQQQAAGQAAPQTPGARPAAPGVPPGPVAAGTPAAPPGSRKTAIEASPRIKIVTPRVTGSIALRGGDIDDVTLTDYKQTVDKDSPPITLFSPFGSEHPYFARFGWLAQEQGIEVPGPETVWQADRP
jgi:YidC/Oxa1 family membrane protein insertase